MLWNDNWKPEYGNASRPGLISDGSAAHTYEISTMKDEFRIPRIDEVPRGRRKQLLRKFFWQEFAKKYIDELSKPPEMSTEVPISHYKQTFSCGGFKVTDNFLEKFTPEERAELDSSTKIPLNTYYFLINERGGKKVSHNPITIFRRGSQFRRPL